MDVIANRKWLLSCSIFVICFAHFAGAATLPAYQLSARAVYSLLNQKGIQEIKWNTLNVYTAAVADVDSIVSGPGEQSVDRDLNAAASVYASEVKNAYPNTGAPPLPYPSSNDYFEFMLSDNAVQAWAYMSGNGLPFLSVKTIGESNGNATASWRTNYEVQGSGLQKVYLRIPVPANKVGGIYEQDGPSEWRSRFRVDVTVNGFPVWQADTMRYNTVQGSTEKERYLSVFGADLGHQDTPGNNNAVNESAPQKLVYLYLGTFGSGTEFSVATIYTAETQVFENCEYSGDNIFCSQGVVNTTPIMAVRDAPYPRFYQLAVQ